MRNALKAVLPSVETFARTAKSAPAKKNLIMQVGQIKEALRAADQAAPALARNPDTGVVGHAAQASGSLRFFRT